MNGSWFLDFRMPCWRRYRGVYIGATSNLDPQIKPTLSNGVDLIFKVMENRRSEEGLTGGASRPAGLQVRPSDTPVSLLAQSKRVFWSLPKSVSSRINEI